ncbi:UBN2 domain-containing protein [Cucumis melo var. makuwa]|uniref:UBN2 domain-containing protein n=1 Tax=Cucumis melo var. makuwa TaxID=1194695 RepID=A0A5D3BNM9_CUCMM|nr:UBN2 domain-containing protein [Cucumis melo var. makuwa]
MFQVRDVVPKYNESDCVMTRGRGRGGYRGRGHGTGKGYCWYKNQRTNFAAENEASENNRKGENKLFMTNIPSDQKTAEVWFIDSGCSNHMTSLKPVFKEFNEEEKLKVELETARSYK